MYGKDDTLMKAIKVLRDLLKGSKLTIVKVIAELTISITQIETPLVLGCVVG